MMTLRNSAWLLVAVSLLAVGLLAVGLEAKDGSMNRVKLYVSSFAVGEKGAIHACEFDAETGAWTSREALGEIEHPFFMALSADKSRLYSIHAPGRFGGDVDEQIAAFKVRDDGGLDLLSHVSTRGTASCYLDIDAAGKVVVAANYLTGSVASFAVQSDGSLNSASSFIEHGGRSVDPQRQEGPHAHCIVFSPDDRFALAADLGLDQILNYRLEEGRLTPHPWQPFVRTRPGAGPRHLTFAPGGKRVYVINELENSITRFDYDGERGILAERETISTLPDDFEGTSHCADLKITSDGRFLYGTNRGHDSLAAYRIESDGSLALVEIRPSLGRGPQNLAIVAGDTVLLCANMPGNNVAGFRIDRESGRLTPLGEPLSVTSPSCLQVR